jgi:hypothetical protein
MRASIISNISQLNPTPDTKTTTSGGGKSSSSSHLTAELLPKHEQKELNNNNENHITVGTQTNALEKSRRRRKHGDRSLAIAHDSLIPQSTHKNLEVLCT